MYRRLIVNLLLVLPVLCLVNAGEPKHVIAPDAGINPSGNSAVWEAEWVNRLTGTFEILPDKDCSGSGSLRAREGSGRQNGNEASYISNNSLIDVGVVDYYFTIPSTGQYQMYMKLWAMDKCGNSCWVSIDSLSASSMRYFPGGKTGRLGSWRHNQWPDGALRNWIWATDETFNYTLKKGQHHMRIKVREDGFAIDQIALLPVNSPMPTGSLTPTQVPGSNGLPAGMTFSNTIQSKVSSNQPTPFDLFFTVNNHALLESPPITGASAWVRLNAPDPTTVEVTLNGPDKTDTVYTCTVSPSAPLAHIPLTITLPPEADRRNYSVSVRAVSARIPNFAVTRKRIVKHNLDWMISSPIDYYVASQLIRTLNQNRPATKDDLPRQAANGSVSWKQVHPEKHYDPFGAIDLEKVHGPLTNKAVVAATWITVTDRTPLKIYAGGDDKLMLYADGRNIMADYRNCPLTDSINYHPVQFTKGKILLVAVSYQGRRWWQFQVDFRGQDRQPTDAVIGQSWK